MEIAYLGEKNVRIKGKQVTLVTQLSAKSKNPSDGVLLLGKEKSLDFFKDDAGVIFQGPGEYEVKGTKITGFTAEGDVMYTVHLDGINIFVGYVSSALKMKDKLHEHHMAILFADEVANQSVLGVLNASVVVFTGEKLAENAKSVGKEVTTVNKYAVTKDKLPSEPEFIFLG